MEKQDDDNDGGRVWAVIDTGTRRLLCKVQQDLAYPTSVCNVYEALELQCDLVRLPSPQGIAELYHPSLKPVDLEDGPCDVHVCIANVRFLSRMSDNGARYMAMRENLLQALVNSRAQRAGILPASQMPKGGRGGPILG